MEQKFLSRREAAKYLNEKGLKRTAKTFAKYASIGGGPKFRKFGARHVVYEIKDLDEWVLEQLSETFASTSEMMPKTKT
jgi:hypothetical protein